VISPRAQQAAGRRVAGLLVVVLVGLLVVLPLARLVEVALGDGLTGVRRALSAPGALRAIAHTLQVSVVVTVLAVVLGTALALGVERHLTGRRRTVLRLLVAGALVVPEFVLGFAWSQAYGPAGLIDRVTGLEVPGLLGPFGIILVTTVHALPLAYLAVAAGLAVWADADAERAARCSGASWSTALRTVTLPQLRVPLLAGAALVFVGSVNSFAIPQVLGTPAAYSTMTTLVYRNLALSSDPGAFTDLTVVALCLVILVLLVVGPADLRVASRSGPTGRGGPPGPSVQGRSRGLRWLVAGVVTYAVLAVGVPLLTVVLASITQAPGLLPVPSNWTLANFGAAFDGNTPEALARTLVLGIVTAVAVLLMGSLVAVTERHRAGPMSTAVTLAYAVPGSALAVAVVIAYGRWLTGTTLIILIAYLGKLWALGARPLQAAIDRFPLDVVPAARVSGARPITALRTISVPLLMTALVVAGTLVFLTATHELTMSAIMYGPGSETFAVVVLDAQELGDVGASAALAVVLVAPVLAAAAAWLVPRRR